MCVCEFIQCKSAQVLKSFVDGLIGAGGDDAGAARGAVGTAESFTNPASRRRCYPECLTDRKQTHRGQIISHVHITDDIDV